MPSPDVSKIPRFDPSLAEDISLGSQAESYMKFFSEKLRPVIEKKAVDDMARSKEPLPYEVLIGIQMKLVALREQESAMQSLIIRKSEATRRR